MEKKGGQGREKGRGHYRPILLDLLASRSERQTGETVAEAVKLLL